MLKKTVSKLFQDCFTELSNHSNNIILATGENKMKTLKIVGAISILALLIVGATLASVMAYGWGAQNPYSPQIGVPGRMYTQGSQVNAPVTQTDTQTPTLYTPAYPNQGYGGWGGCMGRWGWGQAGAQTTAATPLTIAQATEVAKTYVASLTNPDLTVKQIEEYQNNFYVAVMEKSTGNGAFELLINKATGIVTPEPGPNMMWNTQYTFGAGFCNWLRGTTTATPTVTADQAKIDAQQYLDSYIQGITVGDVTAFHGYYTVEILNNGAPYGMLSVNGVTGQVWFHAWHGAFVQEQTVS
jgi:hypothetical protein